MAFFLFLLYFVIIALILLSFLYVYFQYAYTFWSKHGVPNPKPEFPFGNGYPLTFETLNFGDFGASIYNEVVKRTRSFGGFYMFSRPVYLPVDPELIKDILIKNFHIFQDRGLYYNEECDPLSCHLVNLKGSKWKNIRAKVSPTFTSGKIKGMFQTLLACSNELENVLTEPTRKGEPIDIRDIMLRLTTDNIGSCAFGIECNSLKYPDAEMRRYGKLIMDTTFADAKWNVFAVNCPSIMKFFKIPITNRKVTEFFMSILHETVDYREKNKVNRKDFLDLFIKLKNNEFVDDTGSVRKNDPLTFDELAAQAYLFFIGGFETSGTAMSFCLFELSQNQEIQEKLRREIIEVLGRYNGEITYEALAEMTYMDKVINEALRLYPSLPFMNRVCNQPYTIPGTEIVLPTGTSAWISTLAIHRDPEYYPEPLKFDPERFSDEEKAKRHPFTYLPFGEGPRTCLGIRFGLLQMKVAFTKLLKSYKFTVDPKTVLPMEFAPQGIMISPRHTIWLRSHPITE